MEPLSLIAGAHESGIPVTVHVAVGTDIIHFHPSADGAAIGETSMRDFRILAGCLEGFAGGVALNVGSAVVLPEVFLKVLTLEQRTHVSDDGPGRVFFRHPGFGRK